MANSVKKDMDLIKISVFGILLVVVLSFFDGCSKNSKIKNTSSQNTEIMTDISDLTSYIDSTFYSKKEMDIIIEIQSYKISKRMLYDNNAIVRTKIRPDDRMVQYDEKIESLTKKLKQIRRNDE